MKKQIQILIALLALSFAAWGQRDRVKTVETRDSASLVVFDASGNNVSGINVQEAIEESNPIYTKHVFLSQDGDNATGVLGDPHRAFKDPWVAQDSLSGETNLSFLAYQGDYSYTGVGAGNEFTRADTFTLFDLSNSTYSMLNVTGGNSTPFITDRTNSNNSERKYINIFAPNSNFFFSDLLSIALGIGIYNKNSFANINVKKVETSGGRNWGIQAVPSIRFKSDTLIADGEIGVSVYTSDFTSPDTSVITRNQNYEIGYIETKSSLSSNGAIRWQGDNTNNVNFRDSLSTINLDIGTLKTTFQNALWFASTPQRVTSSRLKLKIGEYIQQQSTTTEGIFTIEGPIARRGFDSLLVNSEISVDIERVNGKNRLISILNMSLNSTDINIDIERAQIQTIQSAIRVNNSILKDSSTIRISCENCFFNNTTLPVVEFNDVEISPGSKIIISGFYNAPNLVGDAVFIGANVDADKIFFENATFINDGTSEWIQASGATTITGVSGLYSNSNSTVNVTIVGNKKWGYNYPKNDTGYDLQTVLDSIFFSIPKHSATLYQSTLRQYTFTQDTITIDTLSNALMTDSITQDTGYIRNMSSDTMRWQVSYNFFRDSDEDALTSFMDITTDGGDIPEAIPGSRAYSEQAVTNGTQHAGPTFTVDVPPGAALRLCVYSISAAAGVDISDMTISVEEIYRE